jgi:hypothetical protein
MADELGAEFIAALAQALRGLTNLQTLSLLCAPPCERAVGGSMAGAARCSTR